MLVRYRSLAVIAAMTAFAAARPLMAQGPSLEDTTSRIAAVTTTSAAPAPSADVASQSLAQPVPMAQETPAGVQRMKSTTSATMAAPQPPGANSGNMSLMIVGGAGLLVGALVGGKAGGIIMVGGAVVGLWGLYQYMR